MLDTSNSAVVKARMLKTARLLKNYFEHKLKLDLDLLTEAPTEPLVDGLQFDLAIRNWGIWGLRSSQPLPQPSQVEIAAGFHGLLAALHDLETRRVDLMLLEERFQQALENLPSNVIPLRRTALAAAPEPSNRRSQDKRWMLKLDCLIESNAMEDIHKLALEIYSASRRLAFVLYEDLDKTARLNLSELQQMGTITIFVRDILHLSLHEQKVLAQLLKQDSEARPLVMVGAHLPYPDLRTDPAIHLELLALLSRAYIKLTRPFSEYKDNGLIHYFLDSLSQNPT